MANTSLDEQDRLRRLEEMNAADRAKRLARAQKLARAGQFAAAVSGHSELAEGLGDVAELAHGARENPEKAGALRNASSNVAGGLAGKMAGQGIKVPKYAADKLANRGINVPNKIPGAGLSGGQAAAIGGAVSGALRGEGATGIAKSAAGWYALYIAFGFLTIGSFTVLGFIGALLYLDFHFVVSQITKGNGFFVSMNLWQKFVLGFANLVAALIPLAFVLLVYSATCGNSIVSMGIKAANIASFGYVQDFCRAFKPGRSGGAGASAEFPPLNLDIVLTSAYRPGSFVDGDPSKPSAHGRGEAFDVALRNPSVSFRPNPPDPRIAQIINLASSIGFSGTAGDIVDEYNNPSPGTTGPHIHIEFNAGFCGGTTSANPPTDLVAIPSSIPMSGVSDARVRSCMLPYITQMFELANPEED